MRKGKGNTHLYSLQIGELELDLIPESIGPEPMHLEHPFFLFLPRASSFFSSILGPNAFYRIEKERSLCQRRSDGFRWWSEIERGNEGDFFFSILVLIPFFQLPGRVNQHRGGRSVASGADPQLPPPSYSILNNVSFF